MVGPGGPIIPPGSRHQQLQFFMLFVPFMLFPVVF
jgi:hypothetical protein